MSQSVSHKTDSANNKKNRSIIMLKAIILLILFNCLLLLWSILTPATQYAKKQEIALLETGIPALVLLADAPNDLYRDTKTALNSSCYSLGPFNSQKSAQQVGKRIRDYGLAFEIRAIRSLETLRYLVYIPPLESATEARLTQLDLIKQGIKNINIITEGRYKNAISIGFYSNLTQARRETQHVRYLGYDARQSEEKSPLEVFWINYDEPFGSNTPVITWSHAIAPTAVIQQIPRSCG
jgi:hypothetical protein